MMVNTFVLNAAESKPALLDTLLRPNQGAYHYGKSTEDILLVAVDFITQCLDNGKAVCASFLDFCKAFD